MEEEDTKNIELYNRKGKRFPIYLLFITVAVILAGVIALEIYKKNIPVWVWILLGVGTGAFIILAIFYIIHLVKINRKCNKSNEVFITHKVKKEKLGESLDTLSPTIKRGGLC